MTDKLKSWMTNPFFEVVLRSSEVVISNNDLIKDVDVNEVNQITLYYVYFIKFRVIMLRKKCRINEKNNIVTSKS